jgi:NAD(P)H dehydrogenase (quinone)
MADDFRATEALHPEAAPHPGTAPKILIAFYSRGGTVEKLAEAIAEGALSVGARVRVRRARELVDESVMARSPGWREEAARMNELYDAPTVDDAAWADGIILGSPTRFGAASSELRAYLETLGPLWVNGQLLNKVASAFTSASAPHGGVETTILGLYPTMAHLNMVIVPTGYAHPNILRSGTPYGAASVSYGADRRAPTEEDLQIANFQGERVARVAHALRALRHSPAFDS